MILKTFHGRRRLTAWLLAALIVGLPFVRVNGESALRFDIPSLKLYFFGSVFWISEAFFFLLALLLFFIGIMLFTVLFGRIWCGWVCPQTVLSDFSKSLAKAASRVSARPAVHALLSHTLIFSFSVLVSASLIWYFVSPYQMFMDTGALGPWTGGSWIFFTTLVYLDFAFVRHRFCGSVCPYARMQSVFFDDGSLTIGFDRSRADECMRCEACVRDCPMGIDIRDGLQVECINCAQCIDTCAAQMDVQNKKPLIRYLFGSGGENKASRRPRVVGLSVVFAMLAALFVYQIILRMPVDFLVLPNQSQPYHRTGFKGTLMNAYDLFVENRSLSSGEYRLSISGVKDAELAIVHNPFTIPMNSGVRTRIYVFVKKQNLSERITLLRFTLESTTSPEIRVIREAPFVYPERTDEGVEI